MKNYDQDLVYVDFDTATPQNNFKLLSGTGLVTCSGYLRDELFGLSIRNTLRIRRTVEIYDRQTLPKIRPLGCGCEDSGENLRKQNIIDQKLRWIKVSKHHALGFKTAIFYA